MARGSVGRKPTKPTTLTAMRLTSTSARLAWIDTSTFETGFQIQRRLIGGSWFTVVSLVVANVATYDDATLTASAGYEYRVRAVTLTAQSPYSNIATLAAVIVVPDVTPDPDPPTPPPAVEGPLALQLVFSNGDPTLTFTQSLSTDIGDYIGPFVRQKCYRQRQGNWTVFFRPDADGLRDEVVVELGTIRVAQDAVTHIMPATGGYTATISKNGVVQSTVFVPYHWWWARWRWQSAARPFVRTAAELITSKAVLPYSSTYLYGYAGWTTQYTYSKMGIAGLDVGMAGVGDRPELGPLTEPQSAYLLNPLNTIAKTSMIAQAEASGTMPIHYRDELTGAPFNVQANPYYSTIPGAGAPRISFPQSYPQAGGDNDPNFFRMDAAHTPSLAYLPYLLTDDPYYLEELQSIALFHMVWSGFHNDVQQLPGLVYPGETRAFAWGVRSVGHCAYATPASVPSWLNTKSYWTTNLADNRTYIGRYMASPAQIHTIFRAFTTSNQVVSFMVDFTGMALAWLVRLGFTEWAAAHTWMMGAVIPMCENGTPGSGWLRGWPAPYIINMYQIGQAPDSTSGVGLVTDTSYDAVTPDSWAALWTQAATGYIARGEYNLTQVNPPGWNGTTIATGNSSPYYVYWRAADLHLATGLSVTGASAAASYLDSQVAALLTAGLTTGNPRFSFSATP